MRELGSGLVSGAKDIQGVNSDQRLCRSASWIQNYLTKELRYLERASAIFGKAIDNVQVNRIETFVFLLLFSRIFAYSYRNIVPGFLKLSVVLFHHHHLSPLILPPPLPFRTLFFHLSSPILFSLFSGCANDD